MSAQSKIVPWFGDWPPILKGVVVEDENKSFFERHRLRLELSIVTVLGAFGSAVFSHTGQLPFSLAEHLFMAMAVAGFIALFIDLTLHQEISKNVFKAAIGYLLPEELRDELRWIYNFQFLCEKHTETVRLLPVNGKPLVIVRCSITRIVKNITGSKQFFHGGLGLNEWFHDGHPSRIIRYTLQKEGESEKYSYEQHVVCEKATVHLSHDKKVIPEIAIDSGKRVIISMEYEETRSENDLSFIHFGTPTKFTSITVIAPDSLEVDVAFSHRSGDPKVVKVSDNTWQLNATLLPLQAMRVTWYNKQTCERWEAATA